MRITQEYLNGLSPVELQFIQASIYKLCQEKITNDTTNYDNLSLKVEECPHCGSTHFVKNGFNPKHKQKYRCKECRSVFLPTTKTMFSHSKTTFNEWSYFIGCELNGLTLEAESIALSKSKTTCFHMRHKLYEAISHLQNNVQLSGNIEFDPAYTKINLKGTKKENMPRMSKHRGKHKTSIYGKSIAGISSHKVCILTAVDENDNILLRIGGLGPESVDKFMDIKDTIEPNSLLISDDKKSIKTFANMCGLRNDFIPSIAGKQLFTTPFGNSLSSVNEIHTEVKDYMRHKKGISTRHLQGYLDWIVFKKKLRYTLEMKKWKWEAYMYSMHSIIPFINNDIYKREMPISLYEAYGSYHYGIFEYIN